MRSADRFHSPAPEELMEYVDGEGTPANRAAIEAHLATCAACQALAADQRRLTDTVQAWQVPAAPAALQPPRPRSARAWWHPSRTLAAGLAAAAVVLVVVAVNQQPRRVSSLAGNQTMPVSLEDSAGRMPAVDAPGAAAGNAQQPIGGVGGGRPAIDSTAAAREIPVPQAAPRAPSVIRTARLQIVTKEFVNARAAVESIVASAAGFIDHMTVSGDTSQARLLRGTLRFPASGLGEAMNRLRGLGQVLEDTQGTQDVSDQIVDLDARLASARATERRLTEVLRTRTGRLSDVLEVERELTRVRFDIERLEAEKTNVGRRVSYATVEITVTEERKESLDGPLSMSTRLRVAALDGLEAALDTVAAAVFFVLRAGPVLVLWGTVLGLGWLAVRRFRGSPTPTASE